MVKVSYNQKPYRRSMMESWGAKIVSSPSMDTQFGQKILADDPDNTGSLGIAISEAVEDAATKDNTKYALGSVLNHVLLHQTVIGLEAKKQMEIAGDKPDIVIGCVGGGSNFAGLAFPYLRDKINGADIDFRAIEPSACPTLTRGKFTYDFGDMAQMTPLVSMHTLGHTFMPPGIHAGGLRYHGMAPLLSHVVKEGLVDAYAYQQVEVFDSAALFAKTEGIIPAPESAHAIKGAVDAAIEARESGEEKTILFNLSGHGHFDMSAYDAYFAGNLTDYRPTDEDLATGFSSTKGLPTAD
jgi:tryptophan synthase beta chain